MQTTHNYHITKERERKLNVQSRMDNPDAQDTEKQ